MDAAKAIEPIYGRNGEIIMRLLYARWRAQGYLFGKKRARWWAHHNFLQEGLRIRLGQEYAKKYPNSVFYCQTLIPVNLGQLDKAMKDSEYLQKIMAEVVPVMVVQEKQNHES